MERIKDIKGLCAHHEQVDCFVLLNGGLRSSKTIITHADKSVTLYNEVDGTSQHYKDIDALLKDTKGNNIKNAQDNGALIEY